MTIFVFDNYKFDMLTRSSFSLPGIFLKSKIGQLINSNQFNIPPPSTLPLSDIVLPNVIQGDEEFALSTTMMKPFPRQQSLVDRSKAIYNYRHCRARRTTLMVQSFGKNLLNFMGSGAIAWQDDML